MVVVSILSGNIMHTHDYTKELEQNIEQLKRADKLIRKLHTHLGTSADLDFNLWKETEKYCKDNDLILVNGHEKYGG